MAVSTARRVNDFLAAEVAASDGRLAGFATVALQDVGAAVKELTRAVTELGFCGAMVTPGVTWSGGTVGTITGRKNVAGLFAGVVSSLPNVHTAIKDAFGQGDEVLVRMVVNGKQEGALLGISATGLNVQWDALDVFRLNGGKISAIWAGDDWTAILFDTGTFKAPWIP